MSDFDRCFDNALCTAPHSAVTGTDADEEWFERAAADALNDDERAPVRQEAIGAASLAPDRQLARRPSRRRPPGRHTNTNAPRHGVHTLRRTGRLLSAGVLLMVVTVTLALLTSHADRPAAENRSAVASASIAATWAAVAAQSPRAWIATTARDAIARQRQRAVATRRARLHAARRRDQPVGRRSQPKIGRRRRSRPVAPRPMAPAPAPPMAPAPARPAARPVRAPDPPFTPGDLPLASEAP
jgi:hypothetical protein